LSLILSGDFRRPPSSNKGFTPIPPFPTNATPLFGYFTHPVKQSAFLIPSLRRLFFFQPLSQTFSVVFIGEIAVYDVFGFGFPQVFSLLDVTVGINDFYLLPFSAQA